MNAVKQLTIDLDLREHVIFLDALRSDAEIAFMYNYCDIFVFPCDHQSWGLAPLEAMLFAKPVIVSSGSGVSEVLEGVASIVPSRNPRILAASILNMIRDEPLTRRFAERGRKLVTDCFTYNSTGRQLEELWGYLARSS